MLHFIHMIRVGVIRGGVSNEYEVSLNTGATILSVLREHFAYKYIPIDILITKDGIWHKQGRPMNTDHLMRDVDVVFNALHGIYGEDGQVQQFLESLGVLYTGSGPLASAIGMNKKMTKDHVKKLGIKTADEYMVTDYRNVSQSVPEVYFKEEAQKVFLQFAPPWVIKPIGSGSSVGVSIVKTQTELVDALRKASETPGDIMVEQYIKGKEATVAVTDNFRGQETYSFLPIEIRVPTNRFFDYEMKYSGKAEEISPGNFSQTEKVLLQDLAKQIYKGLGLRHYARIDFILTPKGAYMLEVNTLPGMTSESLVPKSLPPVGSNLPEFVDHIIQLAHTKK